MAWFKRFYDPIILPDGRKLLTLGDAAEYIAALPKAEHKLPEVALETLLKAPGRGTTNLMLVGCYFC